MSLGIYRHYKSKSQFDKLYFVFGNARHSEDADNILSDVIMYKALYGSFDWFVRPSDMFNEYVTYEEKYQPRFKKVIDGVDIFYTIFIAIIVKIYYF
jgi:hypothetical protein